jgi:hypothetical protein
MQPEWDPRAARGFGRPALRARIGSKTTEEAALAIDVHAARIPDRDKLLELLIEQGLAAKPHDELEIVVEADGGDVFREVEGLILQIGAPFVPLKHDGVIYVRPPVG